MKLFHKIFLCFVILFSMAFQVVGYLLINFAYENAVEQEKKFAFQEFQYNKYILQSLIYSKPQLFMESGMDFLGSTKNFTVPLTLYGADKKCLFTNMKVQPDISIFSDMEDEKISFLISEINEEKCIYVYNSIKQNETTFYFITVTDISLVVETQSKMITYFQKIYLIFILCIGFPIIFLLTSLLTKSIKKVSKAATRIAKGEFEERICIVSHDEIGELAVNFNQMAEKVEEKIAELSDAARKKEEFTANFAHELKTPLTSVIGYADMLYQRELPRNEVKSAAEYIVNEGMRLEALSLKLMDLFVLDKQDFLMERISVQHMFENLLHGIEPVCEKYGVKLHMDLKQGSINAEYDLFKTMILNIIDNAVKADSKDIWIHGSQENNKYQIQIKDNGNGIPTEELERITEAFYVVDKSRSRKQHGAGIGMALVAKIVELHKAEIRLESDGKTGANICLLFHEVKGGQDEESI